MKEHNKDNRDFEKIKVFSSEDEKLKMLGELLSNKSSRDIIKLLMKGEHYTNEIANILELRPNLVIHHLKKIEELGLLEITNKKIVKKGNEHRHYRIKQNWFITPNYTKDEIENKGIFQRIFRDGIKIVAVGFVGAVTWFSTRWLQSQINVGDYQDWGPNQKDIDWFLAGNELWLPILLVATTVAGSYFLIMRKKKRG